jgi:hypothetical protein
LEETLYDKHGSPIAYIADDGENSIYLWRGHAVAYTVDNLLYGWNGRHLGWYEKGILYDGNGWRIGSLGQYCPCSLSTGLTKYEKYSKYAKFSRYAPYTQPTLSSSYGDESLEDFLKAGAVSSV